RERRGRPSIRQSHGASAAARRSFVFVAGALFVVGRAARRATGGRLRSSRRCGGLESDPHEIEHIQQVSRGFILLDELGADETSDRQEPCIRRAARSSRDGGALPRGFELLAKNRRV